MITNDRRPLLRWFVRVGDERIPYTRTMRGEWPGWAVECRLCGWQDRTGGGVRHWVRELAFDHLIDEHNVYRPALLVH